MVPVLCSNIVENSANFQNQDKFCVNSFLIQKKYGLPDGSKLGKKLEDGHDVIYCLHDVVFGFFLT